MRLGLKKKKKLEFSQTSSKFWGLSPNPLPSCWCMMFDRTTIRSFFGIWYFWFSPSLSCAPVLLFTDRPPSVWLAFAHGNSTFIPSDSFRICIPTEKRRRDSWTILIQCDLSLASDRLTRLSRKDLCAFVQNSRRKTSFGMISRLSLTQRGFTSLAAMALLSNYWALRGSIE